MRFIQTNRTSGSPFASFLISLKFECLVLILFPIEIFDITKFKRITIKDKTNRHGFGSNEIASFHETTLPDFHTI